MNARRVLLSLLAVALVAAATWGYLYARSAGNVPRHRAAPVERGPLVATVSATGTLNAVITVQVGSQISGQIKQLLADFNSVVRKGQLIARIDPESFQAKVNEAKADVESARAMVLNQEAALEKARADVENIRAAVAARVAAAQLEPTRATIKQKQAARAEAQVDLDRTSIYAPVDGVVVSRNVDVGQTVAASLQAPVLFTIAQDLTKMQVDTNVDEADVGRIQVGQRATFTVDSFPMVTFRGEVNQIRKAPQILQNVVTYDVVIYVQNADQKLLPGMTANVKIIVASKPNVLTIPNAALRFRPPGAEPDSVASPRPEATVASDHAARDGDRTGTAGRAWLFGGSGRPL